MSPSKHLQNIIEIVSSEQSIGTLDNKAEILGFRMGFKLYYGFILAAFTFIVLLFMNFLNYLERFKSKIKKNEYLNNRWSGVYRL